MRLSLLTRPRTCHRRYERESILRYFEEKGLFSPIVNDQEMGTAKAIGKELVPDVSRREMIHKLLELGKAAEQGRGASTDQLPQWLVDAERQVVSWDKWGQQTSDPQMTLDPSRARTPVVEPPRRSKMRPIRSLTAELGKIYKPLDKMRAVLADHGVSPPKIVVLGNESSGKSSVLEALIGMPVFPRLSTFCTRLAIHVKLRRPLADGGERTSVTMAVCDVATDALRAPRETIPIATGYRHVQDKMRELVAASAESSATGVVTGAYILLEVVDPNVPVLDLIDLPGMVHVDTTPGKKAAIQAIYDRQIEADRAEGGTSIYLAVSPMPSEANAPVTNAALQYVKDQRLEDRTIGVFTMADGSPPDELRSYVTGEDRVSVDDDGTEARSECRGAVHLRGGWVTTMLKMPADKKYYAFHGLERLARMENDEKLFFGGPGAPPPPLRRGPRDGPRRAHVQVPRPPAHDVAARGAPPALLARGRVGASAPSSVPPTTAARPTSRGRRSSSRPTRRTWRSRRSPHRAVASLAALLRSSRATSSRGASTSGRSACRRRPRPFLAAKAERSRSSSARTSAPLLAAAAEGGSQGPQ